MQLAIGYSVLLYMQLAILTTLNPSSTSWYTQGCLLGITNYVHWRSQPESKWCTINENTVNKDSTKENVIRLEVMLNYHVISWQPTD